MSVLVIGGRGFVGAAAVRALEDAGHEVVTASRTPAAPGSTGRHIELDRQDDHAVGRVLDEVRPQVLLDMACFQPFEVEAILRSFRGDRYVYVSSQSVYADLDVRRPVAESDFQWLAGPPMHRVDDVLTQPGAYAAGKQWCETLLARQADFPWVALRLPAVFGRDDHTTRITSYLQRADDGGPLLVPRELIDLRMIIGWVDDVGVACARASEVSRPVDGNAYNIAYDDVTGRQFVTAVATALGRSPRIVELDAEDIPPQAMAYGPYARIPGSVTESAKRDLDFRTTPLAGALVDVVEWFRTSRPTSPLYATREHELDLVARAGHR